MADLELVIGTSTKTGYLTPNTLNLYDNLDARTALSFQLRMPTTDTRPEVGQPVYLASATSTAYTEFHYIDNPGFETGSGSATAAGWIGGTSSNKWAIGGLGGVASAGFCTTEKHSGSQSLKLIGPPSGGWQVISQMPAHYTTTLPSSWRSYLIKIDPGTYRYGCWQKTVDAAPAPAIFYGQIIQYDKDFEYAGYHFWDSTDGTNDWTQKTLTFTQTSTEPYIICEYVQNSSGEVYLDDLKIEKVTLPYVFGGSLDNYTETCFPFTNELQLNCNAVDFTQMVGKRLVYKSYVSSGLGEYDSVATTESFTGNGVTRAWTLTYPLTTDPTITVNGFAASVAPVGSASTFGYYYTPSSYLILGNTSNSAPASTDTLSVVYTAIVGKPAWDSDIIKDINDNFFNGEGIDAETCVSTGQRISELNFNYTPGNEAINTICKITGMAWYIDPFKRLHYFARSENPSPFNINSTSDNWRSLTVKRSRDSYRNKEYILGSYGYLPTTETFAGDGQRRTFSLTYPVRDTPAILVDGYHADVGDISGSSTHAYLWSLESNIITASSNVSVLASTDTLTVQYLGLYPVVAVAADGEEILARAAVEGNSGIYEEAQTGGTKTYIATAAIDFGSSILAKYGKQLDQVEFETDIDGLASGQLIKITVSNNNLDAYYYITSVTARDISLNRLRYKVVAVSGTDRGGWVSFFRDLVSKSNSIYTEPYVNLVQTTLLPASGNVKFTDGATITVTALTICYVDSAQVDTGMVT